MSKITLFLSLLLGLAACTNSSAPPASSEADQTVTPDEYSNYEITPLTGTNIRMATRRDQTTGKVLEQGFLDENNLKTREWIEFNAGTSLLLKITNYVAGVQNGLRISFNEIGQVAAVETYKDDQLNGYRVKYRFNRPEEEAEYKAGQLHGTLRQYFVREGWLQFTTDFKDGVQDGFYRAYDKEGNVTLEYVYRNGEKISGGMK